VGDVIESLEYGTARKCSYEKCGVPVLRIPNVANGKIDHSDIKYADLPSAEWMHCLRWLITFKTAWRRPKSCAVGQRKHSPLCHKDRNLGKII